MGKGISKLQQLKVDLSRCTAIASVDELGKGLSHLHQLTELKMTSSSALFSRRSTSSGKGISQLQQLTVLKNDLSWCTARTSVDELAQLQRLTELRICFSEWAEIRLAGPTLASGIR